MPNHVRTVIRFRNLKKKEDFDFLTNAIARPLTERDDLFTPDHEDWIIDFNKIIPEPETIDDCPAMHIRKSERKPRIRRPRKTLV